MFTRKVEHAEPDQPKSGFSNQGPGSAVPAPAGVAANIANGDTPGYVAKELNFSQALREASGSGAGRLNLVSSSDAKTPGHIGLEVRSSMEGTSLYARPSQPSGDNNSVDMDRERASFADNSLHYEATLRFINSHMRTMLSAIQGQ